MVLVWLQNRGFDPWGRKLRYLAVACVRRLWDLLPPNQRDNVDLAEALVEGERPEPTDDEWNDLADAIEDAEGFAVRGPVSAAAMHALYASFTGLDFRIPRVFNGVANARAWAAALRGRPEASDSDRLRALMNFGDPEHLGPDAEAAYDAAHAAECAALCGLVEEVYGHWLHDVPAPPADVLSSNDGAARRIAEEIYLTRAYAEMPVLADALEDAGADERIVAHMRSPGPHVRGCWAIDLVLGRD